MFRSCDEREEEQQRAATREEEEEEEEEEAKRALLPPPRRTVAAAPPAAALADIVALICGVRVSCLFFYFEEKKKKKVRRKIFLSAVRVIYTKTCKALFSAEQRARDTSTHFTLSLNLHRAARVLRKTRVFIKKYLYKKEREADDDDAA